MTPQVGPPVVKYPTLKKKIRTTVAPLSCLRGAANPAKKMRQGDDFFQAIIFSKSGIMLVLTISFLVSFLAVIVSTSEWLRSSFVSNPAGSLMAISVYLLITGGEFLRQASEEIKALHSPQHIRRKFHTFTGVMAGSLHGAISSLILHYTDWTESEHLAHFIGWGLVLPVISGCIAVWVSLWACKQMVASHRSKP